MAVVENLAAASGYIPFLNLQYIYCFFVSLFGGTCAVDAPAVDVPSVDGVGTAVGGAVDVATTTVTEAGSGFWSWLWPFSGGGASDGVMVATSTGSDVGFWIGLGSAIPGPIIAVASFVGWVIAFIWAVFSWISFTISGLLFLAILGAGTGLALIRIKEWNDYGVLPPRPTGKSYGWSRWQDLLDASMSAEPKRWREAIIASDGMLGELLTRLGYHGETTAEQLRSVPDGAFITLAQAWEAHRIKNFVAQRSSNYILTQREAFRVLKLYEQVFDEFDFI